MNEEIKMLILDALLTSPGIQGFATVDLQQPSKELPGNSWSKGICLQETETSVTIEIALIIRYGSRASAIVTEAYNAIYNVVTQHRKKIKNIKIYIRGVK